MTLWQINYGWGIVRVGHWHWNIPTYHLLSNIVSAGEEWKKREQCWWVQLLTTLTWVNSDISHSESQVSQQFCCRVVSRVLPIWNVLWLTWNTIGEQVLHERNAVHPKNKSLPEISTTGYRVWESLLLIVHRCSKMHFKPQNQLMSSTWKWYFHLYCCLSQNQLLYCQLVQTSSAGLLIGVKKKRLHLKSKWDKPDQVLFLMKMNKVVLFLLKDKASDYLKASDLRVWCSGKGHLKSVTLEVALIK